MDNSSGGAEEMIRDNTPLERLGREQHRLGIHAGDTENCSMCLLEFYQVDLKRLNPDSVRKFCPECCKKLEGIAARKRREKERRL